MDRGTESRGRIVLIVLLLTLVAALPRLHDLGKLGFYGDEETTAMPALAVLQGKDAVMPSGMHYYRALPQTWLNALSARIFGEDKEFSYRLPAAIFGILTVPLLFFCARPFAGVTAAALAALLLGLSEWHILTSREARMYAPFLFFYLATAFSALRWAGSGRLRDLLLALTLYVITVSLHTLGMLAALFFILPVAFAGWSRPSPARLLLIFAATVAWARFYSQYFVLGPFKQWNAKVPPPATPPSPEPSWLDQLSLAQPGLTVAGALLGLGLGLWLAHCCRYPDRQAGALLRQAGLYGSAATGGLFSATGNLHGAALAFLIYLTLHPEGGRELYRRGRPAIWTLLILALAWIPVAIQQHGLVAGLKAMVMFPFPYDLFMLRMYPGVFLAFIAMSIFLAVAPHEARLTPLRALSLACLATLLSMGTISEWGGLRYLIEIYPFMLVLGSVFLLMALNALFPRRLAARGLVPLGLGVAVSGILGGHGLPQTLRALNLAYGEDADYLILTYPYYPDHQAPGRFVKAHLRAGDLVVAEDPLEQWWYVRQVDYWLRDPENHRAFLHVGRDGLLRDNYVASAILTDDLLARLSKKKHARIWVITSGETAFKRDYYLSTAQLAWLDAIEQGQPPLFVGRDGVTKVYCLHCNREASGSPQKQVRREKQE